jgi:hypothetical protein
MTPQPLSAGTHAHVYTFEWGTTRTVDTSDRRQLGLWTTRTVDTSARGHIGLWTTRPMDISARELLWPWTPRRRILTSPVRKIAIIK